MSCTLLAIDWEAVGSVGAAIGGIGAGGATIALAIAGFRGLNAWKAQAQGTARINAAAESLVAVHRAADVLRAMLAPWVSVSESAQVPRRLNESEADWKVRAPYSVAPLRYAEHSTVMDEARLSAYKARAWLDEATFEHMTDLLALSNRIIVAFEALYISRVAMDRAIATIGSTPEDAEAAMKRNELAHARVYMYLDGNEMRDPQLLVEVSEMETRTTDLLKRWLHHET